MEAKTPKEILEIDLPSRFKPEKAQGINTLIQMLIRGPRGGSWIVMIRDQKMEVKEGTHQTPNITIEIAETDFLDLIYGKLNGTMAFFSGKLKIRGDIAAAMKLKDAGFL